MDSNKIKKADKFKVLVVLAIVALLSLGVYMYQGNEVSLNLDGEIIEVVSYSKTVEEFIQTEEIKVKEGAYISVPLDTKLKGDLEITITNPKNYIIDQGGMLADITSVHTNVEQILNDINIELGEKDYTFPDITEDVKPNTIIELYKVEEVIEIQETVIPFEKQVTKNNRLEVGIVNVVQEGKDGLKRSEIKNEYINGKLNSSVVVKDEVISEPIPHITEKGSKDFIVTSRGDTRYRNAITMNASAYDLSFQSTGKNPGDKYYGITASGTRARPGTVAVDPKVIPLGTKLYVQSLDGTKDYGFAIAEDKGSAIKGNKIDLFFNTAEECRRFGRRKVKVYVLD